MLVKAVFAREGEILNERAMDWSVDPLFVFHAFRLEYVKNGDFVLMQTGLSALWHYRRWPCWSRDHWIASPMTDLDAALMWLVMTEGQRHDTQAG